MAVSRHTIVDRAADQASLGVAGTAPGPAFRSPWALPPLFLVPTVQVVDQIFDSGVAAAALPSAGSPYASSMVRSKV